MSEGGDWHQRRSAFGSVCEQQIPMASVNDCVEAAVKAVGLGLPAGPFKLGFQPRR